MDRFTNTFAEMLRRLRGVSGRRIGATVLALAALLLLAADGASKQLPVGDRSQLTHPPAAAYLVPVPLPITGNVDTQVKRTIKQILERQTAPAARRELVVIEFRSKLGQSGEGSEFERSLSLARYLASDRLTGLRTVAFVPKTVRGHAVLAVLACEEIIIADDAILGEAGAGEPFIDETMRSAYREIADRRHTVPATIALGMLDPALSVYKAETLDGTQYVLEEQLKSLRESAVVNAEQPVVAAGDLLQFTGSELRLNGFASHLANSRSELAAALDLPRGALEQDPSLGGSWRPLRVDLHGPISAKNVNWLIRSMKERLDTRGPDAVNLVFVVIDSAGGSLADSLRLANFLAGLDATQVRTVAFVKAEARGDAALVAWACDHMVMREDAILGGPGAINFRSRELRELRTAMRAVANEKQRNWSLAVALVDPEFVVYRYTDSSGETRFLSEEEVNQLNDPGRWQRGQRIATEQGLSGAEAHSMQLVHDTADSLAQVKQLFQLDAEMETIEPSWAHVAIERLSSPEISGTLLFIAWFALIIEVSHPGISVAGFASALCFLLFFWSNFLHGTAEWLEILLFVAGVASLVVEIFVLPGFGVFGIGGACLVIASLVLASQTFIIPRNPYQLGEFANSMMMVTVGLVGAFTSLLMVRKYLPDAPLFKRMMLPPPADDERDEREERELLADYRHLLGKRGQTTTKLTPSGKARFGDEVINVISDGDAVAKDREVFVADVRGNRVLVQATETLQG